MVRFARENSGWGYDRIAGALANLCHHISDETVGNILRRHDVAPAPKRSQTTTWREFIRRHPDVLAGTDFFTVEVLTWRGLVTYYVLFFLHLNATIKAKTTFCSSLPLLPLEPGRRRGIRCRERLGGLLRYYSRAA